MKFLNFLCFENLILFIAKSGESDRAIRSDGIGDYGKFG
jgi:hypothetical protein